jgi:hypothetical protein
VSTTLNGDSVIGAMHNDFGFKVKKIKKFIFS